MRYTTLCCYLALLLTATFLHFSEGDKNDAVLKILAVGSWGNESVNPRTRIFKFATDWINNNPNILPNARLEVTTKNCGGGSSGNPAQCIVQTTLGLLEANYTGVMSGSYTADIRVIQFAASAFKKPQINSLSSGSVLSNKNDYPTLLRFCPSDALTNWVIIDFIASRGWKNAIIALEDGDWGAGNRDLLMNYALQRDIHLETIYCPTGDKNFLQQAAYMKAKNFNVIIVLLYPREGYTFVDSANRTGLLGPNTVMIFPNTIVNTIFQDLKAVKAEVPHLDPWALRKLMDGSFGFAGHGGSGPLYDEVTSQYNQIYNPTIPYYWYAFDSLLAYALAVQKFMERGILIENINSTELYEVLRTNTFNGVTNYVYLDQLGDRQGLINIHNIYADTATIAAEYDPTVKNYTYYEPFHYVGNRTDTPVDIIDACECGLGTCDANYKCVCPESYTGAHCEVAVKPPKKIQSFNESLSIGLGVFVFIAFCLSVFAAVVLGIFWVVFTKHGSLYCAVIISGTFFAYVAAAVLLPEPTDALCLAFPWFLGVGFILTYGCLFIKTWALFNAWHSATQFKKTSVTPKTIIMGIGLYLAIEVIFLAIWSAVDPPEVYLEKMLDDSYMKQCRPKHPTFWIIFVSIKGVWLFLGVVLSILTRNVSEEYSESKSIAYATYNNMLLGVIAVPLALTLRPVPNGSLIIEVCVITLAFGFTLFILFFQIWNEIFFPSSIDANDMTSSSSFSGSRKASSGNSRPSPPSSKPNSGGSRAASNASSSSAKEVVHSRETTVYAV